MARRWVTSNSAASRFVEKQMRNWEIARSQRVESSRPEHKEVEEFVTVSRRPGSGGTEVAGMLGEALGWPVFDKQILHTMAGDDEIRRQVYESMDQRDMGWFEETLRAFMQDEFETNDYFRKLTETALSLARQGSAVFLGRGIDLILPQGQGMRIRLVAGRDYCAGRYAQQHNLTVAQATKEIERHEREVAGFVRRHFKRDRADPTRYDLIVNMERFTTQQTVDLVLSTMGLRGIRSS